MRPIGSEWNEHRRAAVLFALYWSVALGLEVSGWHKPPGRGDMVPFVIYLHVILPLTAGALLGWWRRAKRGGITGGMVAGAAVLAIDVPAMLGAEFIAYHIHEGGPGGERATEIPVFLIAIALVGSLLGLLGATCATLLARALGQRRTDVAASIPSKRLMSSRTLLAAAVLVPIAAVLVSAVVIPDMRAVGMQGRAIAACAANAAFSIAIAVLLTVVTLRKTGAFARVLVVMAGVISLLLGSTLLDAASAIAHGGLDLKRPTVACSVSAAVDFGAAILCFIAARGRSASCAPVPSTT